MLNYLRNFFRTFKNEIVSRTAFEQVFDSFETEEINKKLASHTKKYLSLP